MHLTCFCLCESHSFPKIGEERAANNFFPLLQNLICGKNLKIDKSIHTAYVKAIRSAQRFIYIENQYFIGSSYYWPSYKNAGRDNKNAHSVIYKLDRGIFCDVYSILLQAGAHNLIPMELALKIASKISANQRFSVYIVIPMWPEGIPDSAPQQEILFWQV